MNRCPACHFEPPEGSRFCPACGVALQPAALQATGSYLGEIPTTPAEREPARLFPLLGSAEQPRFAPGSTLLGRYRIISALGRGGMGEIYRADDLRLHQQVAL